MNKRYTTRQSTTDALRDDIFFEGRFVGYVKGPFRRAKPHRKDFYEWHYQPYGEPSWRKRSGASVSRRAATHAVVRLDRHAGQTRRDPHHRGDPTLTLRQKGKTYHLPTGYYCPGSHRGVGGLHETVRGQVQCRECGRLLFPIENPAGGPPSMIVPAHTARLGGWVQEGVHDPAFRRSKAMSTRYRSGRARKTTKRALLQAIRLAWRRHGHAGPGDLGAAMNIGNAMERARKHGVPESEIQRAKNEAMGFKPYRGDPHHHPRRRDPQDEPRRGPFTPEEQHHRDELARTVKGGHKPTGSRMDKLRWIVREHQAARVDGAFVDAQTANLIVQIYDRLKDEANRAKFVAMPMKRMADTAWKIASRSR